ncbi:MAG TPA: L-lactate dehydrogenase [Rhodothermales bacterium]
MPSIGIIGTGWVGTSVAISTLHTGAAQELLLFDKRPGVAEGEAMDLSHGAAFYPAASVRAATIEEMLSTSAVVIAAGRGGSPTESRLDLLRDNAAILRDLGRQFADYSGIVVVVTNPVDVLTHVFQQSSGLPPERVLGTGTMLDTARLRQALGRELRIDPRSIHAQVVGEHGDSEVVLWSSAMVGGVRLREWPDWSEELERRVAHEVRTAAYEIIQRKGSTNHAIGLVTATLLKWMLRGERRILNVSRVQSTLPGLEDVALSLPTIVGSQGAVQVLAPAFDDTEQAAFQRSADVLRAAIQSVRE